MERDVEIAVVDHAGDKVLIMDLYNMPEELLKQQVEALEQIFILLTIEVKDK